MGIVSSERRLVVFVSVAAVLLGLALSASRAAAAVDEATCYANTLNDHLRQFRCINPNTASDDAAISGIGPTEDVVGIDFANRGQLYGVTRDSTGVGRVYTLSTQTASFGAATLHCVITGAVLDGMAPSSFGVDFDTHSGVLRIVSDKEQNLSVDPTAGACPASVQGALHYPSRRLNPNVTAAGYDSFGTLFDLDTKQDLAVTQDPIAGTLTPYLDPGFDIARPAGLDVGCNDEGLAAIRIAGSPGSILVAEDGSLIGSFGNRIMNGLAIDPATCGSTPV